MSELSNREQKLVALAAAIASNCVPCVEYHIPEARNAGLTETQLREAVQIANKVRRVPARMVLETALARIDESTGDFAATPATRCGCAEPNQGAMPDCGDTDRLPESRNARQS